MMRRAWLVWGVMALAACAACAGSRLNSLTPTPIPLPSAQPSPEIILETHLAVPATPTAASNDALAVIAEPDETPPAAPPRLLIAALQVDAAVVFVPVREGAWDVSQLGADIGRLETTGQRPGADWAMALVGHVSTDLGQRGPFSELQFIRPDTEIVYRADGTDYVYAVREKARIKPTEVERLYLRDGAQLLLMTCTDWDFARYEYSDRLLVRAELVEQRPAP